MKWIPDSTGRFKWRPYYDQAELDNECERIVTAFLKQRYGEARFPVSTDDLAVMVEQHTSDLDLYADLSREGEDVEGVTEFFPHKKPAVRITRELSLDTRRSGRLRTTLAHEYAHVRFHAFLWDDKMAGIGGRSILDKIPEHRKRYAQFRKSISSRNPVQSRRVLYSVLAASSNGLFRCKQTNMLDAPYSDWMEWQASYAAGAFLMPLSYLQSALRIQRSQMDRFNYLAVNSKQGMEMVSRISELFDVPDAAARLRLEKVGFLQNTCGTGVPACAFPRYSSADVITK